MYTIPKFFNLQCLAFHGETITCLIAFLPESDLVRIFALITTKPPRHPILKISIYHLIIDELRVSFRNQPAMGISILLANKTIPTINSSANICSIIMDMPAIFNAREDLISSDTDHSPLLRLYEPH